VAIEEVLRDALALDPDDRERLLVALHDSLEPDDGEVLDPEAWDAAWSTELKKRLSDLEEGRATVHTHQDVMHDLRARLHRR
jgi:putative addiction module component (TIGR02574 family)